MTTWLEQYVMRRASPIRTLLRRLVQEFALREALGDRECKPRKLHLVKDDQARLPLEVNR